MPKTILRTMKPEGTMMVRSPKIIKNIPPSRIDQGTTFRGKNWTNAIYMIPKIVVSHNEFHIAS